MATLVMALALAALAATPATAGQVQRYSTTVVAESFCGGSPECPIVEDTDWVFDGSVASARRRCAVGRRINLYAREPGPDERIGYGFSDGNRNWVVTTSYDNQSSRFRYYAHAPRKKLSPTRICRAGTSNVLID